MVLTADRLTDERIGYQFEYPVVASDIIYGGSIVFLDASGNAEPASLAAGKICAGICTEQADNSSGAAAAIKVKVKRGCFKLGNYGSITKTSIGDFVYAYDDYQVQASATTASPVGILRAIDTDGVWVEIMPPVTTTGLLAANNLSDVGTAATAATNLGLGTGDSVTFTDVTASDDMDVGDDLRVVGLVTIGETLAVTGNTTLTGTLSGGAASDIALNTDKFTVDATQGNTLVAGTFEATGAQTLTGNTTLVGTLTGGAATDIALNTNKFTVDATQGNTLVAGTFEATGAQTLTGNTLLVGTLTGGAATDIALNTDKFTVDATQGNTVIAGTCKVAGELTGLQATQTVAASAYTVVNADDGDIIIHCAADNDVVTLPAVAAGNLGQRVTVVNVAADDAALISISPNASDAIYGTISNAAADCVASGTDDEDWTNTKAGSNKGDYTVLESDGSTGWFIIGGVGVWASV